MRNKTGWEGNWKQVIERLLIAGVICFNADASAQGWQLATNLALKADLTVKETFDSNVYLQDVEPDLALVPQAVQPFQESFVTSITPRLALDWKPCAHFNALVSYAPDVVFYHSEPSEDHVAHRGLFNFGGTMADITWDAVNTLTWVDGSDEGLYFGGPGGAPAIGGIPIRERRDQFVYRSALKATWSICERLFVRPVITGYCHDFQTVQKNNALGQPDYGYENYVDRSELTTGLDLGWQIQPQTRVFVGYRYGKEVEGRVVGSPYHYDSTFHRPLAGIEGQPAKWIKLAVAVGPDIHHTTGQPAPGFDVDYTTVWSDTVVTLLPTEKDSLVLTWKANTQPAFASPSVYDDITYDATAKHRFDKHWTVGAGFRTYIGDWMSPVDRDDWIYTVSTGVAYTHNKHLGADLTYSYDWVDSKVSNTEGREFTRHFVSLALKYTF